MTKPYPPVGYSDYLKTRELLTLQNKRSEEYGRDAHDEMLFIIIHQTYELWFKQILTELDSVLKIFSQPKVDERNLGTVVARLNRITEIQRILIDQVSVLETMTPLDFLEFRDFLYPASGFQSVQFRLIENKLGLRREVRLPFNAQPYTSYVSEGEKREIEQSENEKSIFDLVDGWLTRTPFLEQSDFAFWKLYHAAVKKMFDGDRAVIRTNKVLSVEEIERNVKEIDAAESGFAAIFDETKYEKLREEGAWHLSYKALHAALLIQLYRDQPILQLPFRILVALQDIDENFTTWRYRHALMAHRMLGSKIGTGGSTGHRYLKAATDKHRVFSDFFNLATFLIPRSALPDLPEAMSKQLGFYYR